LFDSLSEKLQGTLAGVRQRGALTDDDIKAVVAHELGHVWIFTHHPYLQTEQLANEIAMRLVTRESLEPVYAKVQKRIGDAVGAVDLARNLGDTPAADH